MTRYAHWKTGADNGYHGRRHDLGLASCMAGSSRVCWHHQSHGGSASTALFRVPGAMLAVRITEPVPEALSSADSHYPDITPPSLFSAEKAVPIRTGTAFPASAGVVLQQRRQLLSVETGMPSSDVSVLPPAGWKYRHRTLDPGSAVLGVDSQPALPLAHHIAGGGPRRQEPVLQRPVAVSETTTVPAPVPVLRLAHDDSPTTTAAASASSRRPAGHLGLSLSHDHPPFRGRICRSPLGLTALLPFYPPPHFLFLGNALLFPFSDTLPHFFRPLSPPFPAILQFCI